MEFDDNKPIYIQIADNIAGRILSGELKKRGFQKLSKTRHLLLKDDVIVGIFFEKPTYFLYIQFFILPLFLPWKGRYTLDYGNRFNMLFEDNTGHPATPATPYPGKLKLQYQDNKTKEWVDVGDYVAFGEATERAEVRVRKPDGVITSGYESIMFRLLTESGDIFQYRSGADVTAYSDWQYSRTLYIGRVYEYIIGGVRTGRSPSTSVYTWTSN